MIKIIKAENFSRDEIKTQAPDVSNIVSEIINNVKTHGDKALFEYERKFDNVNLDSLEVTQTEINDALNRSAKSTHKKKPRTKIYAKI